MAIQFGFIRDKGETNPRPPAPKRDNTFHLPPYSIIPINNRYHHYFQFALLKKCLKHLGLKLPQTFFFLNFFENYRYFLPVIDIFCQKLNFLLKILYWDRRK